MADLARRRSASRGAGPESTVRRTGGLSADEVAYWVTEFADAPDDEPSTKRSQKKQEPAPPESPLENPFPPGYGEDLFDDAK